MITSTAVERVDTAPTRHSVADRAVSDRTRERILDAVPDATRRAYGRQWGLFETWCAEQGRSPLPATAETLAEYVGHLVDAGLAPTTVQQAVAAIRTAHRSAGHDGEPDTRGARLVLRGHRRERAAAGQRARQAPPVTIESLRAMIETCDPATVKGLRDRVVLVLGLAMMGRRSELAALEISDVTETPDGLELLIRSSKTDQEAIGAVVAIPPGQHPDTDPVRLVRAWLDLLAEHGITTGRLLRSVTRYGRLGASLSGDGIADVVRTAAVRAGLRDAQRYSAHSLRAGGATSAYRAGAPVSVIAQHGRWSPGSPVVLSYVRAVDRWRDNALRGVGL
jgi:integrase